MTIAKPKPIGPRFILGVTGGIGSGKSSATDIFQSLGIDVVDADVVAREVVEPGSPALLKITEHFGPDILSEDGRLDRSRLREIVFADPDQKKWLEALLHPIIRERTLTQLDQSDSPYVILSSPLLLETNQRRLVNRVLLIDVPVELQISRTTKRDTVSEQQVKTIIAAQADRAYKTARADDIIINDTSLADLRSQVERLHTHYLELASAHV
ncbi:MAG: dephospho-CoA kinase [Gammaproteobacteria bacterium]|nr:MAG: dephospho-CoA kinase [Gammaproteobacteria bacterium]